MSDSSARPSDRSRREFLKTSSALVGGTLVGGGFARSVHAAGSDEIKIGVIGCGGRGRGAASDTLEANTGVRITALGDAFADAIDTALHQLQPRYGDRVDVPAERRFAGFDAYQQVIDSGVDMVILATSPGFRPIHFEAAVNAGKHVFMEKPVAVDAPGVRRVLAANELAKKKGLGVGVGLQRHHSPKYQETIQRIHDGAIGEVLFTRVYWNGGGVWVRARQPGQTEMEYQMRNWYYFNWLCGDHIVEQHIHNLDVSNWVLGGYPVSAHGMGGREVRTGNDHGEIFDHHSVEFTYANGAKMFSQCRHIRGCWSQVGEFAHGAKGVATIHGAQIDGEESWRRRGPGGNPMQAEHAALVASIRGGNPINEGDNGAYSTMTAILGRMATYSGKVIDWDQALASKLELVPEAYHFNAKPPTVPDEQGNYPIPVPGKTEVL